MATKAELSNFSREELHEFLVTKYGFEVSMESLDSIKNNKIGGMTFLELTSDEIKELITLLGERKTIQRMINSYTKPPQQEKEVIYCSYLSHIYAFTLFHFKGL